MNAFRYAEMVKSHLEQTCEIVSEHHADEKFMVVSAASIVAKVTRDRAISDAFKKIRGYRERISFGSGHDRIPFCIYR